MGTPVSVPMPSRAKMLEEERWLPAARRGETWALEQLYHAYQPQIYALCYRLLGRAEDAQDAAQAAFVRAFVELARFRGDSAVRTWLYRIAVNEAMGMLRRRRNTFDLVEENAGTTDDAPAILERLTVRAALARMRPEHRAILVLRYREGLRYQEIAVVLGISMPAVKMRLLRARDEFRKCYDER
jgi:RNA polymerase sigma-70 factor, ECF subfamily